MRHARSSSPQHPDSSVTLSPPRGRLRRPLCVLLGAAAVTFGARAHAQAPAPYDSASLAALQWRDIGPFRGGRSVAVAGSATRPFEYYMGTVGGGVFKTTDGGVTWKPITDKYYGGT